MPAVERMTCYLSKAMLICQSDPIVQVTAAYAYTAGLTVGRLHPSYR